LRRGSENGLDCVPRNLPQITVQQKGIIFVHWFEEAIRPKFTKIDNRLDHAKSRFRVFIPVYEVVSILAPIENIRLGSLDTDGHFVRLFKVRSVARLSKPFKYDMTVV